MLQLKNIKKLLLSCLVLLGLTLSVGVVTNVAPSNSCAIELVLKQNKQEHHAFVVNKTNVFNGNDKHISHYNFWSLLNAKNNNDTSRFKLQQNIVLKTKPTRLKIVLNDISTIKSHCI
ncbi:hypothetical protein MBM09_09100 [Flaviramulus sp. BrNp1-15]|uniref:hypothetical protein n=1 Tax=Flaviramulus sp. BrNp1-15 TaxID=2916754 RepID=UPI001EE7C0F4|nr:hypothetical protein [Flaviramulus sp. BrNp1-15]ULC58076.1 hypothetical protein MBM09_09100 [Flaviramulus sp. BrNp1-15]